MPASAPASCGKRLLTHSAAPDLEVTPHSSCLALNQEPPLKLYAAVHASQKRAGQCRGAASRRHETSARRSCAAAGCCAGRCACCSRPPRAAIRRDAAHSWTRPWAAGAAPAREALRGTAVRPHGRGAGPEPAACRAVPPLGSHRATKLITALCLPIKPYYADIRSSSSDARRFSKRSVQARRPPAPRSAHLPAPLRLRPRWARSATLSPAAPQPHTRQGRPAAGSPQPGPAGAAESGEPPPAAAHRHKERLGGAQEGRERPRSGAEPARLARRRRGASPTAAPPHRPNGPGPAATACPPRPSPALTVRHSSAAPSAATPGATAATQRGRAVSRGGQSAPGARGPAAAADGMGGAALRRAGGGPSCRGAPPAAFGPFRSPAAASAVLLGVVAAPCRGAAPAEASPLPLIAPQRCAGLLLGAPAAHRKVSGTAVPALPPCGSAQSLLMVPLVPAVIGGGEQCRPRLVRLSYRRGRNGLRQSSGPGRCRAVQRTPPLTPAPGGSCPGLRALMLRADRAEAPVRAEMQLYSVHPFK